HGGHVDAYQLHLTTAATVSRGAQRRGERTGAGLQRLGALGELMDMGTQSTLRLGAGSLGPGQGSLEMGERGCDRGECTVQLSLAFLFGGVTAGDIAFVTLVGQ